MDAGTTQVLAESAVTLVTATATVITLWIKGKNDLALRRLELEELKAKLDENTHVTKQIANTVKTQTAPPTTDIPATNADAPS